MKNVVYKTRSNNCSKKEIAHLKFISSWAMGSRERNSQRGRGNGKKGRKP